MNRRTQWWYIGMKRTRQILLEGKHYVVPRGVYRDTNGWRMKIERTGEPNRIGFFGDKRYGSIQSALSAAQSCVESQTLRPAYDQISLRRVIWPQVNIYHRSVKIGERTSFKVFLELQPSKAVYRRTWHRQFVGTWNTVTQPRIDAALRLLVFRWLRYHEAVPTHGREAALTLAGSVKPPKRWRIPNRDGVPVIHLGIDPDPPNDTI